MKRKLIVVCVVFTLALVAGWLSANNPPQLIADVLLSVGDLADELSPYGGIGFFIFIAINNLVAIGSTMVSGILFGIVPLVSMALNGYIVGVVGKITTDAIGFDVLLAGILPHGVIEIPLILSAAAFGLMLGDATVQSIKEKNREPLINQLKKTGRIYLKVFVPLTIVTAFIESYVTSWILGLVS